MINPSISSSDLALDISRCSQIPVAPRTIRNILHHSGLRWYTSMNKPFLTKKMKLKRLDWCKKYATKPLDFWEKVLFSDETMVSINLNSVQNKIRRFPWQSSLNPRLIRNTVKHPLTQMFRGCFSSKGVGSLQPIDGIMNGEKYTEVLSSNLASNMAKLQADVFQDDSAPCHRSRVVKSWIQENEYTVLDWPGNSQDLNPIENVWAILKRKLKMTTISNRKALILVAKTKWSEISPDLLRNLSKSMPKRIEMVIKAKGGATKY